MLELLKTHMPKKKILDSFFTAYLKKKLSKWNTELNIKGNIKILEETQENLFVNILSPEGLSIFRKIDKVAFIKIKNVCCTKDTVRDWKDRTDMEKILANEVPDKRPESGVIMNS